MHALVRQHVRHDIGPFNYGNNLFVAQYLGKFIANQPWVGQTVKVKMVDVELWCVVHLANRKSWAAYFVFACGTLGEATDKRGFAAAKVAHELDNFATLKRLTEPSG